MKIWIIFTILAAAFLLFGIPLFLGLTIRSVPGGVQPSSDQAMAVDQKDALNQTFTAKEDNLDEIGMTIRNYNMLNKDPFIFKLLQNGSELVTIPVSGSNIEDGNFTKFKFTPIPNSKGQVYQISLSAPVTQSNPLRPYISNNSPVDPNQILTINGLAVNGTLSFVPYYRVTNPILGALTSLANLFVQLSKDPVFAGVFIIINLVFLGLLLFA